MKGRRVCRWIWLCAGVVGAAPAAASAATLYVAPSGSDGAVGSEAAPLRSLGKAVSLAKAGDSVVLRGGVYRESVTVSGGGTADSPLTIAAYPGEKPVLRGSEAVGGWTLHQGKVWKKTGWQVPSQQVLVDGEPLQQIGSPPLAGYTWFKAVGSGLGDLQPGRFFYDAGAGALYVWLADGSDPNAHLVEASVRPRILFLGGASYVHIKGLSFEHSNTSAETKQGACVELGSHCTIEDSAISLCDYTGLAMGYKKTGGKAINTRLHRNGNTGIVASSSYDFVVSGCEVTANNYRNFDPLWEAGGLKGAAKTWGVVEHSEFAGNNATGVWFDYADDTSRSLRVHHNYIHDNGPMDAGIMIEGSRNVQVDNNVLVNNARRGIYVSASDDTHVFHNTIVGSKDHAAVEIGGMPRPGKTLKNNLFFNNTIVASTAKADLVLFKSGPDISGNQSDNNHVYRPDGSLILQTVTLDEANKPSYKSFSSLAAWQADTGQDKASLTGDPKFVSGGYALAQGSPLRDKARPLDEITDDFVGHHRPEGPAPDIGAFEGDASGAAGQGGSASGAGGQGGSQAAGGQAGASASGGAQAGASASGSAGSAGAQAAGGAGSAGSQAAGSAGAQAAAGAGGAGAQAAGASGAQAAGASGAQAAGASGAQAAGGAGAQGSAGQASAGGGSAQGGGGQGGGPSMLQCGPGTVRWGDRCVPAGKDPDAQADQESGSDGGCSQGRAGPRGPVGLLVALAALARLRWRRATEADGSTPP